MLWWRQKYHGQINPKLSAWLEQWLLFLGLWRRIFFGKMFSLWRVLPLQAYSNYSNKQCEKGTSLAELLTALKHICNLGQEFMGIVCLWRVISQKGWEPSQGSFQIWSNFCFFSPYWFDLLPLKPKVLGTPALQWNPFQLFKEKLSLRMSAVSRFMPFSCSDSGAH